MINSRANGYDLFVSKTGDLLQSGIKSRPIAKFHDPESTRGWITRAVVLQVYFPEEDDRSGWTKGGVQRAITCDVRTYGRYSRELDRVPVLQGGIGLWDGDVNVPRGASINTSGGVFIPRPSKTEAPTPAEDLDGDHVLVGFLDDSPNQPVIFPFALPHPNRKHRLEKASGRIRELRKNGTLIRFEANGDLAIDARGASSGLSGMGDEVSTGGGSIRISTKASSGGDSYVELSRSGDVSIDAAGQASLELGHSGAVLMNGGVSVALDAPSIDLGNPATDFLLKGTTVFAAFTALFTAWASAANAVATGTPPEVVAYTKAVAAAVSAVQATMPGWLSTTVKTR